ncbi:MAG: hypothetical protein ABI604_19820 [Nitrospirota bacterium]
MPVMAQLEKRFDRLLVEGREALDRFINDTIPFTDNRFFRNQCVVAVRILKDPGFSVEDYLGK